LTRVSINLSEDLLAEISEVVGPRQRSRFISEAIIRSLKELRAKKLAVEYKEAASEIQKINEELEGTIGDGLD
jgi:metal-responsive CopG/Arc/MetJ family transcriptional regulator